MFKLEIRTGGAAFRSPFDDSKLDPDAVQLRAILDVVKSQLEHGFTEASVMDCNGNKVGSWSLE